MSNEVIESRIAEIEEKSKQGQELFQGITKYSDPDDLSEIIAKVDAFREKFIYPLGKDITKLLSDLKESSNIAMKKKQQ